ncbi:hypothetical protein HZY62_08055 [Maribacter polysiphoniae]|uniref:Phosphoribosylpyrophosphate synthetase n=1 Tax=Maribacter polysiphoniae TaxID=429344 RepID=A0A316E2Q5_9FLAO|nr:hypothetical protein [Maribacter polysiphoniae]MBD1260539.1 hypothetical protein [Maribacter polysiphoniae]PWK24336.1 hypothetical protein LX92_01926 [Maribacter polysiphoniae]
MKDKHLKSEKDYIQHYVEKGYINSYRAADNMLISPETTMDYNPMDVHIVAEHRFEGFSNPSDMSILYVIETKDGGKGTVLANYSPSSNTDIAEFFKRIPKENVSQKANIHDTEI